MSTLKYLTDYVEFELSLRKEPQERIEVISALMDLLALELNGAIAELMVKKI